MPKKQLQSIVIMLAVAVLAIAGFLLVMGRLSASDIPADGSDERPVQASVAVESETEATLSDNQRQPTPRIDNAIQSTPAEPTPPEEIIATVNNQIISRDAWQQATRLDAAMSRLAAQPVPGAEETLDRLINEILVLSAATNIPAPTSEDVETRIAALESNWDVSDAALVSTLAEADLTRFDLTARMSRLIQVELALDELASRETDLNIWLANARTEAEIGLYRSLVNEMSEPVASQPDASPEPSPNPAGENAEQETDPNGGETPTDVGDEQTETVNVERYAPPPGMSEAPYPDNAAPDFTLARLNGDSLTLSDFRGKPTLINFWASWCPPCRRELPALQAAYATYGDDIGFIAVDVKEDPGTVAAFVEEMGLTFPIAFDQDGQVSSRIYEIRGTPTTVFVDANGVVTARHVGPLDEAMIDSYLSPLLAREVEETEAQLDSDSITAPEFSLTAANGDTISLQDYRDESSVVLVFYRGQT